jgi:hypothetical protein
MLSADRRQAHAGVWDFNRVGIDHIVVENGTDGRPQVGVHFVDQWNPYGCVSGQYHRFWLDTTIGKSLYAQLLAAQARGAGVARLIHGCTADNGSPVIVGLIQ